MIRQERIKGTLELNINGFKSKTKLYTRTYKTGGSTIKPKLSKSGKIVRAEAARQSKPLEFMALAADERKRVKNAKRNAKKYAKRNK